MGFITVQEMLYSREGCEELENRLEILVDDDGAIEILKIANTHGEIHLFLLHVVSEAEVVLVLGDVEDGGGVKPEGLEHNVEDGGGLQLDGVEGDVEDDGGVEPEGLERNVEDGGGLQPEGVESDVEDGGGVEPEGVEGNFDDGGGVESQGVQANVEDGGGVDIGEHHGMEGVGEEDEEEDEGCGGQGDGEGEVRHRCKSKRQTNNPIIIREFVCVVLEHKDNVNGMHIVGSYPQQGVGS